MAICGTRTREQPNWLYDLIAAVEQYEDVHEHVKEGGRCLQDVLDRVPDELRLAANAIADYKRKEGQ